MKLVELEVVVIVGFFLELVYMVLCKCYFVVVQVEVVVFVIDFYKCMELDEFLYYSVEEWVVFVVEMLEFVWVCKVGKVNVCVFNLIVKVNGWELLYIVLQIVNDDMLFLVDIVIMLLVEQGVGVYVLGYLVLCFICDKVGKLVKVGEGDVELVMLLEIDWQLVDVMVVIEQVINKVLDEVCVIVCDWQLMKDKVLVLVDDLGSCQLLVDDVLCKEVQEFLCWVVDNYFIFFGYCEYCVEKQGKEEVLVLLNDIGLGLMCGKDKFVVCLVKILVVQGLNIMFGLKDVLILIKINVCLCVYCVGYMDYIGVLEFDVKGKIIGEQCFFGLFIFSVYNCCLWEILLVCQCYEYVMKQLGLVLVSYSGKVLCYILEILLCEELFQFSEDELFCIVMGVLGLQECVCSCLFLCCDKYSCFIFVLVYLLCECFNIDVCLCIEVMFKDVLYGEYVDSLVVLGELLLVQVYLIVCLKLGEMFDVDIVELEQKLVQVLCNWQDDLCEVLVVCYGEIEGLCIVVCIGKVLLVGYIEDNSIVVVVNDVSQFDVLIGLDDLCLSLQVVLCEGGDGLCLKLYCQLDDILLLDVLLMMENMGLCVIVECLYCLLVDNVLVYVQDFEVELIVGVIDVVSVDEVFGEIFVCVWYGDVENDGFNCLVLVVGLYWCQVVMLCGYCKYLLQIGVLFLQVYVEGIFVCYLLLVCLLVELFEVCFDLVIGYESKDDIVVGQVQLKVYFDVLVVGDDVILKVFKSVVDVCKGDCDVQMQVVCDVLLKLMDCVFSLDEDCILCLFMGVIDVILCISYYQIDVNGQYGYVISFKFDLVLVLDLLKLCLYCEIFVYGLCVEGIYLCFGVVVCGGLCWLDCCEDFCIEVLGLVKVQMVKNIVIVLVGVKGGFFVKILLVNGDCDVIFVNGVVCYKLFIQGLLDIIDNIVNNKIVLLLDVVCYDMDDLYLVVVVDKGMVIFFDIVNGLVIVYGFWMGDVFVFGGLVGYDYKGMGIIVCGVWELVKCYFCVLGCDSQSQDFIVVGVGDMFGDVFGNGMLLLCYICLVVVFDYCYIFLDLNLDVVMLFIECECLFILLCLSWVDYDIKLISKGGGVYLCSLKLIEIILQVCEVLGLDENVKVLLLNDLMSVILKVLVDLLWNGGIGIYVKVVSEQYSDVGDCVNNVLCVNGGELCCKVVGEGGNLGMIQLGCIEVVQVGVLFNIDFIDNLVGVDIFDYEVNIKILFNDVVWVKKLIVEQCNKLLVLMIDEVVELVFNDNYCQNQVLSLMEWMVVKCLGFKQYFICILEQQGLFDCQIEFLLFDVELLQCKVCGQGLICLELLVLLFYFKLVVFNQLLDLDILEDLYLFKELQCYFLILLQKKYVDVMECYCLKCEIIVMVVINQIINCMGVIFLMCMQEDIGCFIVEVVKVYIISCEMLDVCVLWVQIDVFDGKVFELVQIDVLEVIWKLQCLFVCWLLLCLGVMLGIIEVVNCYQGLFNDICVVLGVLLDLQCLIYEVLVVEWKEKGLLFVLVQQLVELYFLELVFDIIELVCICKLKLVDVFKVYFCLGDVLQLLWLFEQVDVLEVNGCWYVVVCGVLCDELVVNYCNLVGQVLGIKGNSVEVKVVVWMGCDDNSLCFILVMLVELVEQKILDYLIVLVVVQCLGQLVVYGV